jgi:hypothetical protein
MPALSDVFDEIMSLSREEQEVIRVHLAAMLDGDEMPGSDVDWEAEIRQRVQSYRDGAAQLLDDDEVAALLDSEP